MILTVKINGTDRSDLINWRSLSVEDRVNEQPNICNFVINVYAGQSYKPVVGDEVIITDETSLKIFAGSIINIRHTFAGKLISYEIECKDYTSELDRIQVIDSFDNQTVTQIIDYINTNYLTGITTVNVNCPIVVKRIVFNRKSVTECLNSLVKLTNYIWYIDYDKDIHFIAKNTEVAPFSLSDNSKNFISDSLEILSDLSQLRNVVVVRGGEKVATNTRDKDHTTDGSMTVFNTDYKFAHKPTVEFGGGISYRRKITIDNTANANLLTDYQVKISLDSTNFDFTKAQSDGSDIDFYDTDGTTELSFWIESWDATGQTAEIWIKVPSILASSTHDIYIYYGGSSVNLSNGNNTFDYFDTCDSLTPWVNNGLSVTANGNPSGNCFTIPLGANAHIQNPALATDFVYEFDALINSASLLDFFIGCNSTGAGYMLRIDSRTVGLWYDILQTSNWTTWGASLAATGTGSIGVWANCKITYIGGVFRFYINGILQVTYTASTLGNWFGLNGDGAGTGGRFDNLKLRKGTPTEPTETVGVEETISNATILTVGVENLDKTGYDCYWDYNQKYIRFDVAPASGQNLKITGNPLIPIIVQVENIGSVDQYGRYEFSKVDKSLKSADDARLYAQAEIDSYGQSVREGSFRTYTAGLSSGQTIFIDLSDINISDTYIIQSVGLNMLSRTKGEYSVEIATTQTMGIIKFLRDKLLNTKNIELNENDVLEKYYIDYQDVKVSEEINILTQMTDHTTINVAEAVVKDPFGQGVKPEFVLTPYTPTGNSDIKREFVLDRGLLS